MKDSGQHGRHLGATCRTKDGLHECREGFHEYVRGLGHDLEVEDLTLHDLSAWDADAKRDIWNRYMPGEISVTDYPTTRLVFVRSPLAEYSRLRYPAWWSKR